MSDFKFRSGKHEGKTVAEVQRIDPSYLAWVKENKPQMLKPSMQKFAPKVTPQAAPERKEPPADEDAPPSKYLPENRNFLNEGPHGILDKKIKIDRDE